MNQFHKLTTPLFILLTLIVFSGCQKAEMNTEMDREAIEAVFAGIQEAMNSGNAASVAAHFGKDASFLAPNQPLVVGRENIEEFIQGMFDMGVKELNGKTVKLEVIGDLAYRIGRYELTIQPEGSESMTDKGKFVEIFNRQHGTWKVVAAIFNTSMPMPSPM